MQADVSKPLGPQALENGMARWSQGGPSFPVQARYSCLHVLTAPALLYVAAAFYNRRSTLEGTFGTAFLSFHLRQHGLHRWDFAKGSAVLGTT